MAEITEVPAASVFGDSISVEVLSWGILTHLNLTAEVISVPVTEGVSTAPEPRASIEVVLLLVG